MPLTLAHLVAAVLWGHVEKALSSSGRSQPLISWVFTGACWVIVGVGRSETLRSNSGHCCPERAPCKMWCRLITHAQTTDVFLTPNNVLSCLRHSHFFIRQTLQRLVLGDRFESEDFPGHFVNSFSKLTASSEIAIPHSRQNGLGLGPPALESRFSSSPNMGCGALSTVIRPSLGPSHLPSSGYSPPFVTNPRLPFSAFLPINLCVPLALPRAHWHCPHLKFFFARTIFFPPCTC